jgi:hypothetical protein
MVLLSSVWSGWKCAAELMKPKTAHKWHEHAFLNWWPGNLDARRVSNANVDFDSLRSVVHSWPVEGA